VLNCCAFRPFTLANWVGQTSELSAVVFSLADHLSNLSVIASLCLLVDAWTADCPALILTTAWLSSSKLPVVVLHPRRWRTQSTQARIGFLQPFDCTVLSVFYVQQTVISSRRCQHLEWTATGHYFCAVTVFRQHLKTFMFRCSYPDLLTL